ncbi:zinc metalloproteinase nas-4-like [Stegodyphus dumicola]|uniref:zinc metalloproteinase nas-4-like n=1 Tax=Stegodyphus dumicola TaxID=202533 RepID=UPI0015AA5ECD|nr:zinc metalloproteinase nas-4-like [Stegodyphus dumicola]
MAVMNYLLVSLILFFKSLTFVTSENTNPTENRLLGLYQGDILLRNGTSYSLDRNAVTAANARWPNGVVYYTLDDIYTESDKEVIRSAIEEFEKQTCIKWVERTDEDDYVEIYNEQGCFSELGRMGGVQSMSLESPSCMKKGVIMHEMMHALGFLHEQSRPDRDDYIQVLWDNIIRGMEPNFQKLSPLELNDLGLDYDYRSIMHYTAHMFAVDRSHPTIEPVNHRESLDNLGYGQKYGVFTDLDLQKINKFYECDKK